MALVMGIGLPVNLSVFVHYVLTPAGMCYAIEAAVYLLAGPRFCITERGALRSSF